MKKEIMFNGRILKLDTKTSHIYSIDPKTKIGRLANDEENSYVSFLIYQASEKDLKVERLKKRILNILEKITPFKKTMKNIADNPFQYIPKYILSYTPAILLIYLLQAFVSNKEDYSLKKIDDLQAIILEIENQLETEEQIQTKAEKSISFNLNNMNKLAETKSKISVEKDDSINPSPYLINNPNILKKLDWDESGLSHYILSEILNLPSEKIKNLSMKEQMQLLTVFQHKVGLNNEDFIIILHDLCKLDELATGNEITEKFNEKTYKLINMYLAPSLQKELLIDLINFPNRSVKWIPNIYKEEGKEPKYIVRVYKKYLSTEIEVNNIDKPYQLQPLLDHKVNEEYESYKDISKFVHALNIIANNEFVISEGQNIDIQKLSSYFEAENVKIKELIYGLDKGDVRSVIYLVERYLNIIVKKSIDTKQICEVNFILELIEQMKEKYPKRISEYNQIIDQLEHYTIQELNFQSKSEYVPLVGKKEFHFQENTNTVPIGLTYNIKYGVKTENRALVGVMIPEEDSIENIQVMVLKEDYSYEIPFGDLKLETIEEDKEGNRYRIYSIELPLDEVFFLKAGVSIQDYLNEQNNNYKRIRK